jgi:hypothetical protein
MTPEANTKLILIDHKGYGLEIGIRTGIYLSIEVFPNGSGIIQKSSSTDNLDGKLRIVRMGNLVTTYFRKNSWQEHAQWTPQEVYGDLKINVDSWNWQPNFLAFSTKFDNLQISNSSGISCVN